MTDNLSNELNKLKIDKSKRSEPRQSSTALKYPVILVILAILGYLALRFYDRANAAVPVQTVRPRIERSSESAVLVATGYVVAHHKIQVGSKIMGRVAWIGVEKGNRVNK